MAEYIEREAAINEQKRFCGYLDNDMLTRLEIATRRIPAADVRPVVLCRDCEYYQADCGWCGLFDIGMHVNDFCSRGKKREEN